MLNRFAIRAPVGRCSVAGVGVLRATDIGLSAAGQEITARSGCDASPWFRAVDSQEITGSLTLQDLSADLEAAISGGTLVVAASGYLLVDKAEIVVAAAGVVGLAGIPLLNNDLTFAGAIWTVDGNGETVLSQLAPDAAPAAGEFSYTATAGNELLVDAALVGETVYVSYAYQATAGKSVTLKDTSEPPLCSILLPVCGASLAVVGTRKAAGLYIPRARFTGRDLSVATGGGSLAGLALTFSVMPASDGTLYRWLYPV